MMLCFGINCYITLHNILTYDHYHFILYFPFPLSCCYFLLSSFLPSLTLVFSQKVHRVTKAHRSTVLSSHCERKEVVAVRTVPLRLLPLPLVSVAPPQCHPSTTSWLKTSQIATCQHWLQEQWGKVRERERVGEGGRVSLFIVSNFSTPFLCMSPPNESLICLSALVLIILLLIMFLSLPLSLLLRFLHLSVFLYPHCSI